VRGLDLKFNLMTDSKTKQESKKTKTRMTNLTIRAAFSCQNGGSDGGGGRWATGLVAIQRLPLSMSVGILHRRLDLNGASLFRPFISPFYS